MPAIAVAPPNAPHPRQAWCPELCPVTILPPDAVLPAVLECPLPVCSAGSGNAAVQVQVRARHPGQNQVRGVGWAGRRRVSREKKVLLFTFPVNARFQVLSPPHGWFCPLLRFKFGQKSQQGGRRARPQRRVPMSPALTCSHHALWGCCGTPRVPLHHFPSVRTSAPSFSLDPFRSVPKGCCKATKETQSLLSLEQNKGTSHSPFCSPPPRCGSQAWPGLWNKAPSAHTCWSPGPPRRPPG